MVNSILRMTNPIKEGHEGICLVALDVVRTAILKKDV